MRDSEVLLLAPSREAADEAFWKLHPAGAAGVHRFSLHQLASVTAAPALALAGKTPATPLSIQALLARLLHDLRHDRSLGYFASVASTPGFVRSLGRTLSELRLNGISPKALGANSQPSLVDLSLCLDRFQSSLERHSLADLAAIYNLAIAAPPNSFSGLSLVLVDLEVHTRLEQRFLDKIVGQSLGVTHWSPPAPRTGTTLARVRDHIFDNTDSRYGEDRETNSHSTTFDETVQFFSAAGEALEAVEIARRVQQAARDGLNFDSMAVLLRSPEIYTSLLEEAFRRASIPAYFSRGVQRPDPAGRAFLSLLLCAIEDCSGTRFAEFLSLGPVSSYGWERILSDAGVIGGGAQRWHRRLAGYENEIRLHNDEAIQEATLDRLRALSDFALPIIDRLDSLPREASWGEWLTQLDAIALSALGDAESASIRSMLLELRPMADVGPVTLAEVYSVLEDRFGLLRQDPPKRRWGHVYITSVEECAGHGFELVFLPGLAEGQFPRRVSEDPLFLDYLRQQVDPSLLTNDERRRRERGLLNSALRSGQRLVFSFPRMELLTGRPRVPSFYALEVVRAALGYLPELRDFQQEAASQGTCTSQNPIDNSEYDLGALDKALHTPGEASDGAMRYLIASNENLARSLRRDYSRWQSEHWTRFDGLHQASLAGQTPTERPYSPTALQRYAACPYQFLLHAVYGLRPRHTPTPLHELDPRTRGVIFHEAQRDFLRTPERSEATLDLVLDQVAGRYQEELAPALLRVWNAEIEAMRKDLQGWWKIKSAEAAWTPLHTEFGFGFDAQTPVILPGGHHLRGRIDLVEQHGGTAALRVVDHKTGRPPEQKDASLGGGELLQPALYALAYEAMTGDRVEWGQYFYSTERGNYERRQIRLSPGSRAAVTQALDLITEGIASGNLYAAPQPGACDRCDYRVVCGPREEKRTRRKPRDPLLEELRGMK